MVNRERRGKNNMQNEGVGIVDVVRKKGGKRSLEKLIGERERPRLGWRESILRKKKDLDIFWSSLNKKIEGSSDFFDVPSEEEALFMKMNEEAKSLHEGLAEIKIGPRLPASELKKWEEKLKIFELKANELKKEFLDIQRTALQKRAGERKPQQIDEKDVERWSALAFGEDAVNVGAGLEEKSRLLKKTNSAAFINSLKVNTRVPYGEFMSPVYPAVMKEEQAASDALVEKWRSQIDGIVSGTAPHEGDELDKSLSANLNYLSFVGGILEKEIAKALEVGSSPEEISARLKKFNDALNDLRSKGEPKARVQNSNEYRSLITEREDPDQTNQKKGGGKVGVEKDGNIKKIEEKAEDIEGNKKEEGAETDGAELKDDEGQQTFRKFAMRAKKEMDIDVEDLYPAVAKQLMSHFLPFSQDSKVNRGKVIREILENFNFQEFLGVKSSLEQEDGDVDLVGGEEKEGGEKKEKALEFETYAMIFVDSLLFKNPKISLRDARVALNERLENVFGVDVWNKMGAAYGRVLAHLEKEVGKDKLSEIDVQKAERVSDDPERTKERARLLEEFKLAFKELPNPFKNRADDGKPNYEEKEGVVKSVIEKIQLALLRSDFNRGEKRVVLQDLIDFLLSNGQVMAANFVGKLGKNNQVKLELRQDLLEVAKNKLVETGEDEGYPPKGLQHGKGDYEWVINLLNMGELKNKK